jgi:antitoxin component YwqK of YwqJK toxin-antitoxin module
MANRSQGIPSKLLVAAFLLLPLALFAQKPKVYWLGNQYQPVKKKQAVFGEVWAQTPSGAHLRTVRFINGDLHIRAFYSRTCPVFAIDSLRHGSWQQYNRKGQLLDSGQYVKGRKEGQWYERNSELPAYSLGAYRNGKAEGSWLAKYDNGHLRFQGAYASGKNHGEHRYYSEKGVLEKVLSYRNDTVHGPYRRYDAQGRILVSGTYLDGSKHGSWVRYTDSRQLFESGTYDSSRRAGSWYFYHPNGKLASFERYATADSNKWKETRLSVQHYDEQGKPREYDNKRESVPASVKGGIRPYYNRIADLVVYPAAALDAGEEAVVMACFTITPEGKVDELRICDFQGKRGYGFEAEVLRVLRLIDWQWEPAIEHNRIAYGHYKLPVRMALGK